jgi:hypothetical protein
MSDREVNMQDLFNLALYRMVCPKAYINEVRAYIHNCNPNNPPYLPSQIGQAEVRLGLYRKAALTTSNCTYFPANLFKRQQHWHAEYPAGILGERTRDKIDLNKSNCKLETQNRKFVKVMRGKRCDASCSKYKKGEGSVSLLMAILGNERVGEAFSSTGALPRGGLTDDVSTTS